MCSIFGVIGKSANAKSAFKTLAHRGQDSTKTLEGSGYFFGSHRLAIESYKSLHNQPLEKNGFIALFNGEIYNYKELIAKYNLDADDEIETILELFILKKEQIISYLRGMYAIAIYNTKSQELWLFRDIVGKKPLYFTFTGEQFIFASEAKAIFHMIGFHLEKRAIHQFLGYGATISPQTLDKYIFKLKPSSYLYFNFQTKKSKSKEFDFFLTQKILYNDLESASKVYEKELKQAIAIRIPKVPWGVLVSGGLDSSLLAAMLSKQSKEKVDIFSIGYDGYLKYDERAYAKELAKHIGANFYSFNFSKKDFFDTLEELLSFVDDPIGDPAQIPLFFLIKKAKEHGKKVLFSGDGSDELHLGYRTYKEYLMMEQVKNLPYANWLKNHLKAHFSLNKEWEWYKRALNKEVIFRSSAELYTDRQLNMLLRLQEKDNTNFKPLQKYWDYFIKQKRSIIDWYSFIDLKVQLAEFFLVKVDRVSMANGIEVRTPYLDTKLIELIFSINPHVRFDSNSVKPILKKIAASYLPQTIINRKKKGLNYPFIEWILEENGLEVIYLANEKFHLFKKEQLDFLSQKVQNKKKFKQHLFPLFMLSKWLLKKHA